MRLRWLVLATALVLIATACGGGGKVEESGGSSTSAPAEDVCKDVTLAATEVGVSATTITVTVIADTGSPIRPGLFKGSVDAVKAWAKYMNTEKGGLACRTIAVKTADSKLSADESKNAVVAACGNSIALVGTTALFLSDIAPMESCKDKAGNVTGLPDLAELQTTPQQQCSSVSFAMLPSGSSCPYSGEGVRTYRVASTQFDYYLDEFGKDALHGVWVIPRDLPSTISASMPGFRASQQLGIKLDQEFGGSGLWLQADYTPSVQAIKQFKATYARNGLDYTGTVLMRKEAAAQGVDTVKVWDCSLQCYDKRLIGEGGNAVEGQYVWVNFLPFEDAGSNATLDTFLKYDKSPDGFGLQAWVAGELFAKAVNDVVAQDGPNGLTRAALLAAIRNTHDFDAGGLTPKIDIGGKQGSPCLVGMQVQSGRFVRVSPSTPGEFNCNGKVVTLEIDALAEFKG